jgi:hypothetical protein
MYLSNRVAARIEQLLPYSTNNQVFINGNLLDNQLYPDMRIFWEYTPRGVHNDLLLGGASTNAGGWPVDFFENILRYRVGLDINPLGNDIERKRFLLDIAIDEGLPVYPQDGSIMLIDGVVVAIFDFLARIDIDETHPPSNSYSASISHTGKSTDLEFLYDWYLFKDGEKLFRIDFGDGVDMVHFEIDEPGVYNVVIYAFCNDKEVFGLYSRDIVVD